MMEQQAETRYQKLTSAIWLAPDHLLYLKRQLVSQRVKRFEYGDIQAIILRQTRAFTQWSIVLIALAGLSALLILAGFAGGAPWSGMLTLPLPTLTTLVILLIHWRLGPTCACHVRTAVQVEHLRSLRRLRTDHRI